MFFTRFRGRELWNNWHAYSRTDLIQLQKNLTKSAEATSARLSCLNKYKRLAALETIEFTWSIHLRSFLNITPSDLILVTLSKFRSPIRIGSKTGGNREKDITIYLHLNGFS